jgi:hypothetical protein
MVFKIEFFTCLPNTSLEKYHGIKKYHGFVSKLLKYFVLKHPLNMQIGKAINNMHIG